ncbi:MAG TPA: AraC family transcriptional regulator [Armatimonadota bacterium]
MVPFKYQLIPTCRTALQQLLREFERGQMPVCLPTRIDRLPVHARPMHFHLLPELVLQISGDSELECPGERLYVRTGELCITPSCLPHLEHPVEIAAPFLNLVMLYTDQHISLHSAECSGGKIVIQQHCTLCTRQMAGMVTYIEQMTRHWQMASLWHRQIIRGLGMALVSELLETVEQHTLSTPAEPHKVTFCTNLVMQRLSDKTLSVKMLAEHVDWSPDYLSFAFHAATGSRLHTFIATQRHELAKRLLTGSDLAIADICQACGYEDPSYFTRVFRRQQGCTPGTYRRQHR